MKWPAPVARGVFHDPSRREKTTFLEWAISTAPNQILKNCVYNFEFCKSFSFYLEQKIG